MYSATKNDLDDLAGKIEGLAREFRNSTSSTDMVRLAHEIVRNSSTFTFTLGEVYAAEQLTKVNTVSSPKSSNKNYYNVRNKQGRFAKK